MLVGDFSGTNFVSFWCLVEFQLSFFFQKMCAIEEELESKLGVFRFQLNGECPVVIYFYEVTSRNIHCIPSNLYRKVKSKIFILQYRIFNKDFVLGYFSKLCKSESK